MAYKQYQLVLYRPGLNIFMGDLLELGEVARLTGTHPGLVERMVCLGLIEPEVRIPQLLFPPSTIQRIYRILRLRNDLGINWIGVGLVLDLLDRIDELEQRLENE